MREGNADKILAKVMQRKEGVSGKVKLQFKGVKPFASQPVAPDEQIWAIDQLTIQDMDELYNEFGDDGILYLRDLRNKLGRK